MYAVLENGADGIRDPYPGIDHPPGRTDPPTAS